MLLLAGDMLAHMGLPEVMIDPSTIVGLALGVLFVLWLRSIDRRTNHPTRCPKWFECAKCHRVRKDRVFPGVDICDECDVEGLDQQS